MRRYVLLVTALAAACATSAPPPGGDNVPPDSQPPDAGSEPVCPAEAPAQLEWVRLWPGAVPVGVAAEPSGASVVGGRFEGTLDLDPGPATQNVDWENAIQRRGFLAKVAANGDLVWAYALDRHLALVALAVTASGDVLYGGTFDAGPDSSIDLDPGPGAAAFPVEPTGSGGFVAALHGDGSFAWGRTFKGGLTALAVRPDGRIIVGGGNGGDTTVFSEQPRIAVRGGPAFLWIVRPDGSTETAFPIPLLSVLDISVAPDNAFATLGRAWGTWDADYTDGVDVRVSLDPLTAAQPSVVTIYEPDFHYRRSDVLLPWAFVDEIELSAAHDVFLRGHADFSGTMGNRVDVDPGPRERWWAPSQQDPFLLRWNADGSFGWFLPQRSSALALTPEGWLHAGDIGGGGLWFTLEADGRRRWTWKPDCDGCGRPVAVRALDGGRTIVLGSGMSLAFVQDRGVPADTCGAPNDPPEAPPPVKCDTTDLGVCTSLGAECGVVAHPCRDESVSCGTCAGRETCGAGGAANRCGRENVRVVAQGLRHPVLAAADEADLFVATWGDYGPMYVQEYGTGRWLPGPAKVGGELWRVPRSGGEPARVHGGDWRPQALVVGRDHVFVKVQPEPARPMEVLRIPKAGGAPSQVSGVLQLVGARDGALIYVGTDGATWRVPEDGSAAPVLVLPATCGEAKLVEGRVYAVCQVSADAELRSVKPDGTDPRIHRSRMPAATAVWVEPGGIVMKAGNAYSRLPLDATASTTAETLGAFAPPEYEGYASRRDLTFEGALFLRAGEQSANTDDGGVWLAPWGGGVPGRIAGHLNHPKSMTSEAGGYWIVEEGSYGLEGSTGRVLWAPR